MGSTGTAHDTAAEAAAEAAVEDTALEEVAQGLIGDSGVSTVSDLALSHVDTRVTDEGLVIEIFSRPGQPLFDVETGAPAPWLPDLANTMASLFGTVTNDVAVEGHIAAEPIVVASETRWQGSTDRAQAMRALLEAGGLPPRRIVRITGHADREPVTEDGMNPRNDRLEVILLRRTF
jgi:chemotaxis protein MotB